MQSHTECFEHDKNVTLMLNKKQALLKLHSWKCTESRVVLGTGSVYSTVLQYTLH